MLITKGRNNTTRMTAPLAWSPPSGLYLVCSLWKMSRPCTQTSYLAGYSKDPLTTSSAPRGTSLSLPAADVTKKPPLALVSCKHRALEDEGIRPQTQCQLPHKGHLCLAGEARAHVQAAHATEWEPKLPPSPSEAPEGQGSHGTHKALPRQK